MTITEDDSVVARDLTASKQSMCNIRSNKSREVNTVKIVEEEGDLAEVEVNYV